MKEKNQTYFKLLWVQFKKEKIAYFALLIIGLFFLIGLYAPFLASSKPLMVHYDGTWYFPLFRYLFFKGFYTKGLDLFFNLLMFTFPVFFISFILFKRNKKIYLLIGLLLILLQFVLFGVILFSKQEDPAEDVMLNQKRHELVANGKQLPDFAFDLSTMNEYKKLNLLIKFINSKKQHERLISKSTGYREKALQNIMQNAVSEKKSALLREGTASSEMPSNEALNKALLNEKGIDFFKAQIKIPTLWTLTQSQEQEELIYLKSELIKEPNNAFLRASLNYMEERQAWLKRESGKIDFLLMPLIRDFHFEDDAGGGQTLNQYLPWNELTRPNRRDLVAALIFGIRISLVVGFLAVGLSLLIAVPVGAYAGYYGGTFDIVLSRILEVIEAMPTFFMLLLVIAITESKSIFLVITLIGLFGWTGFSRFIRGEFFKQRNLNYVESSHAMGFKTSTIVFSHIMPNAIAPLLTLLPFAMMGAITSEAGLSFLGLGEEGSTSWGVLMDEGRSAFPAESYLLWPPALLLTLLLVAIALVGDGMRDAIDPKMRS